MPVMSRPAYDEVVPQAQRPISDDPTQLPKCGLVQYPGGTFRRRSG
jgi:hypothetical protein